MGELNETAKVRKKALAEVRKWIRSQPQIKRARLDSNFILRFLRMQKFEIKESCEILDKYLTMRCQYPTWFQNLDWQTLCPGVTSLCCQRGTSTAGGSFSRELQPSTRPSTQPAKRSGVASRRILGWRACSVVWTPRSCRPSTEGRPAWRTASPAGRLSWRAAGPSCCSLTS